MKNQHETPEAREFTMSQYASKDDMIGAMRKRIAELEAALFAYASEFEPNSDGDPDVGSIHTNIRAMKAQLESISAGGVSGPLMGQPQAMPDLTALTERGAKAWTAVDAQGLREGAASAGSEPVAWRYVDARGHFRYVGYKPSRDMVAEYPLLKPIRLYLHPSPPEGMAVTDAMIDAGKKMLHNSNGRGAREKVERIFNAMIAAAPPTTPAGSGKGE